MNNGLKVILIALSFTIMFFVCLIINKLYKHDSDVPANFGAVEAAYSSECKNVKIFMDNKYKEQGFISIRDMYHVDKLIKNCHEKNWMEDNLNEQNKLFSK